MLFGGIGTFFLSNEDAGLELVFIIPVIAYFLTHYFILLKRRIFQFSMPFVIIVGALAYSFLTYMKLSEPLLVKEEVTEENTMILGSNLNYYVASEAGSPCFNEELSKTAFEGLEYYGSATRIYELITKANPDLIMDEMGVAEPTFDRFPTLEKNYKKVGTNKYRRISN